MVCLICAAGRTDGWTCNDIVLSRHDRKTDYEKIFPRVRKNPLSACVVWLACAGGRVDGRTNNDIMLSRHNRKRSV